MAIVRGQEHEHVQVTLNQAHADVLNSMPGADGTARRRAQIVAAVDRLIADAERENNPRLLAELRQALPAFLRHRGLDTMIAPLLLRCALPPSSVPPPSVA